jgi:hypothetical protein
MGCYIMINTTGALSQTNIVVEEVKSKEEEASIGTHHTSKTK